MFSYITWAQTLDNCNEGEAIEDCAGDAQPQRVVGRDRQTHLRQGGRDLEFICTDGVFKPSMSLCE